MRHFSRLFIGFLSGMAGALVVLALFHPTSRDRGTGPAIRVETAPVNRDAKIGASLAPVVKRVTPSVVYIFSTRLVRERPMRNPLLNDPYFRQFFGDRFPNDEREHTRREQGLGSGVIVSPDGYILTANHVVDGADEIEVSIGGDKKKYAARVIGTDPPTDVAVLKIDAKDLPAITLGDSDQLEVGDVVLAVGDPFGLRQTVTMGIVSALGRGNLPFGRGDQYRYEDFIQTDAPINPGNSGGALVDAEGRLVGINTAIIPSGEGVGFAVPINMASRVMEHLIHGGKVTRGYLGITLQDIDAALANHFNLPDQNAALVDDVMPDTPAEKAGIKSGDAIVEFDGKKISDANDLILQVSQSAPAAQAAVKLIRDGQEKTLNITLTELPQPRQDPNRENSSPVKSQTAADALDGVTVADLDSQARYQLDIPARVTGALVTVVDRYSNAAEAGLTGGDIIQEINRQPVSNAEDAVKLGRQAKSSRICLKVWHRTEQFAGTRYLSVDNTATKPGK
jgi:serine protease Do